MRVIALAHKVLSPGDAKRVNDAKSPLSRDEVECDLEFAGFLAFACRVRTDSEEVINIKKLIIWLKKKIIQENIYQIII